MQFRIYDRQTLAYKDGGYVASYTIDDDYIVNNNSTVNIIKELNDKVVVGDTIVLIKTSGAYHKGTITTFDNADFKITYKADKELFNDNMLNPALDRFVGDENKEVEIAYRFGIERVAEIIESYFGKANDWLRQLPIKVVTDGDVTTESGEVKMLWTWKNDTINMVDWLVELFTSYNLSLSWTIDFNIAERISTELVKEVAIVDGKEEEIYKIALDENKNIKIISERKPYYIVTLSAVTNSGKMIKDNVEMQTITYTEKKLPEATVCVVLNNENKEIHKMNSNKNLLSPYNVEKNKFLNVGEYGYTQETEDITSNISGYIRLNIDNKEEKDGVKVTYYTLSSNNYDGKERYIVFFDKDKKLVKFPNDVMKIAYNGNPFSFYLNDTKVVYCKVCYDNKATKVQLEKGKTATEYDGFNIPAIYYLCEREGKYYVSLDSEEGMTVTDEVTGEKRYLSLRVMPSKMISATFDTSSESEKETTPQEVAEKTLIPSKFNQAIEIQISADSKMFDFENSYFGDLYKIINEHGTIDSNYTGRKEDSSSKWITLYFGLGRQNYTDLIQMRMRQNKYQVVYTK